MRMMFGLVALLVGVGVIMYTFSKTEIPVIKKGEETRQQAQQIAGRDTDGTPVSETFKVKPVEKNGQLQAMVVTQLTPNSAMQRYYGLQEGDQIVQVGQLDMGLMNNDSGMAEAQIQQAYQQQQALVVLRGGQKLTLPQGATAGAAPDINKLVPH